MPSVLDREMDAAVARLTGPDGRFGMGLVERHGQILPYVASAPSALPQFFAHFCGEYGDRDFLVDGDERLSFAETYAAARRVAGALVAGHGVRKGDRVGLAARNASSWITAYMGILMAGGVATLLNAFWTGAELADAIEDTGCGLVIADDRRATLLEATGRKHGARVLRFIVDGSIGDIIAPLLAAGGDEQTLLPDIGPDDDATILFTSGSTGRSKGAVSDHLGVVQGAFNFAANTLCMLDVITQRNGPSDNLPATLLNVPLFHVTAEVSVLLHSFIIGRKLVLMPKWDAEHAMRLIAQEKCTYFIGVPLMSYEIVNHPRRGDYDLSSLSDMASGGAPRPVEHVRRIIEEMPGIHPVIGYGLTETNAVGCGNFRENYANHPGSTGKVSKPLVEMAILDDAGNALPKGQHGEIGFRTVCNFKYYWNRPEDSAATFTADSFFRTGDIGYIDAEDYLIIVDRKKDIIIRGGENISSPEVEAALYEHPAVKECAVFGLPHPRYGEVPGAVVHLHGSEQLTAEALCGFLKDRLAPFKIPAQFWFSKTQLPRLGTEKIDKRKLREMYRATAE